MTRWDAVGSRNMRRMTPTSVAFLGRSRSVWQRQHHVYMVEHWAMHLRFRPRSRGLDKLVVSGVDGALRTCGTVPIRSMRPVVKAKTMALFATWAATKSEGRENCSCTLSTLKIGSCSSPPSRTLAGMYAFDASKSITSVAAPWSLFT
jgi:hypothetical protein